MNKTTASFLFSFFSQAPSRFSFQARSPISYLGNTFSTSVKFILVTLLVFPPGESRQRKGSHYGLVVRLHRRGKSRMSTAISHISSGRGSSGDSICVVNILKGSLGSPLSFFSSQLFLYFLLCLSLSFAFFSSPDSAGLIFLNCLTPKIQISQSGPLSF